MEENKTQSNPITAKFPLPLSRGALTFIIATAAVALALIILVVCAMTPLNTWLEQYETAQPKHAAEEVYDLLFAQPDWALLYDMAGVEATEYEGRSEYVTFMSAKVGTQALTYQEIPAGNITDHRYSVRLGDEEVARFTLKAVDDGVSTFPRWTLGTVEVFFTRNEQVTINIMPGCSVYINGVRLDDSHTTLRVSTVAEEYLPEGVHGYRYNQMTLTGLLIQPTIMVLDERNNPMTVTRDPVTGIYTVPITISDAISQEAADLALAAAQDDALFSIRAISLSQLRQHFSTGASVYNEIVNSEPLVGSFESYEFDEAVTSVEGYYSYTDRIFSVQVFLRLNVTGKDGTVTTIETSYSYIFTANNAGKFMVTQRIDGDLQQIIQETP